MKREWDGRDFVAVFNPGKHTIEKTVPLKRLCLDVHAAYLM